MKTSQLAAVSAAAIIVTILAPNRCLAATTSTIPAVPFGTLQASPTRVQTGTKPSLTWGILYPSKLSDLVTVSPPGTLIPNKPVFVSVQPVGCGVTACDPTQGSTQLFTEARMSLNGSPYQQIFYGIQSDVEPAYSLYTKKVFANNTIDFGGRYVKNGAWSSFYTTKSSNLQVIALADGSTIPTTLPLYQSSLIANYLKPYVDSTGKVKVGPLSVLILMELGQTNHGANCFDYQDMVLLVTFSSKHPNNGHGNNLDGVDSSNPGQGSGGPNGAVDPSAGVDDEIK